MAGGRGFTSLRFDYSSVPKWRRTTFSFGDPDTPDAIKTTRVTTVFLPFSLGSRDESTGPLYSFEYGIPNVPPKDAEDSTSSGGTFSGGSSTSAYVPYTPSVYDFPVARAISAATPTLLGESAAIGPSASSGPSTGGAAAFFVRYFLTF